MLMNSRGGPPILRGGPPLETISMDLVVYNEFLIEPLRLVADFSGDGSS